MRQLSNYSRVVSYDDASIRLFGAMLSGGGQLSDHRRLAIDMTIRRLKNTSVWPKLDFLYMFAALDAVSALINWKNPGTFNGTATNSPVFTADRGYTSSSTGPTFINSNFTPSTAGGSYVQDSACAFGRSLSSLAASADTGILGTNSASSILRCQLRAVGDLYTWRVNTGTSDSATASTSTLGFFSFNRSASNASQIYKNGASVATTAQASTGNPSAALIALSTHNNGLSFNTGVVASFGAGGSMNAEEQNALHQIELAYMQSVGAV